MLSVTQVSPNFGATKITIKPEEMRNSSFEVMDKYLGPVKEHYSLRAGLQGKSVTPQMVADDIRIGEAGVTISMDGKEINIFGKDATSDSFIGKLLTKMFPENAKFTKDIK